jgi:hypothetical protein
MFNHNSVMSMGRSAKCWAQHDKMGLARGGAVARYNGLDRTTVHKRHPTWGGLRPRNKKRAGGMRERWHRKSFGFFQNLPLFLKKSLRS